MTSYSQYPQPGQYPAQSQPPQYPAQPQGYQQAYQAPQGAPQQLYAPQQYQQQAPSAYAQQAPPQAAYGASQQAPQAQQQAYQHAASYDVDDAAVAAAYQNTSAPGAGRGPTPQFLKIPGPRGQQTWDASVPLQYSNYVIIRILGPSAPGKPIFVESKTHFYKSHKYPKGRVLGYQGENSLFMQAIAEAARSNEARLQKIATEFGRVRWQYFYNVLDLSHPESHYGQDGVMRPYLLSAGRQLHRDIGNLSDHRGGISRIVSNEHGRAIRYTKTKNGPEPMNVEYDVRDEDPSPLHPYFYPATHNMWDLEAQIQNPTQDEVLEAIRELNLPMPAMGQSFGQVPSTYQQQAQSMAYSPNPNPPYQNPYPAQYATQGAPPAAGGAVAAPPPYQASQARMPAEQPPPPAMAQGMPSAPPPVGGYQQQPGGLPPPPQPPPMTPPPVSSGGAAPSGYPPLPGNPPF